MQQAEALRSVDTTQQMRPQIRFSIRTLVEITATLCLAIIIFSETSMQASQYVAGAVGVFWLGYFIAAIGDKRESIDDVKRRTFLEAAKKPKDGNPIATA
jgi:hypothetical protein